MTATGLESPPISRYRSTPSRKNSASWGAPVSGKSFWRMRCRNAVMLIPHPMNRVRGYCRFSETRRRVQSSKYKIPRSYSVDVTRATCSIEMALAPALSILKAAGFEGEVHDTDLSSEPRKQRRRYSTESTKRGQAEFLNNARFAMNTSRAKRTLLYHLKLLIHDARHRRCRRG